MTVWPATIPLFPPLPPDLIHFVSGASAPADLRGLCRFSVPLGVSVPDLSAPALEYLLGQRALALLHVFVDSGAFGEVEVVDGRLEVVAPITEDAWAARVAMGLRIAEAFGARARVVAPDRVGDQAETLLRLRRWAGEMAKVRAAGARVVVPLQRGAISTAAFERAAASALDFDDFTPAIPGNKDAMPPDELEAYLRASRPTSLHLLGIGPRSHRLPALLDLCRRLIPGVRVSCDSNVLAALVGHSNGRGGGRAPSPPSRQPSPSTRPPSAPGRMPWRWCSGPPTSSPSGWPRCSSAASAGRHSRHPSSTASSTSSPRTGRSRMPTYLYSAFMGFIVGAIVMFFGPALWFMHRRLKLAPRSKAVLVAIRGALDEAGRVARELNDEVAAERIATLRAMQEDFLLGSTRVLQTWHDQILQVVKLGFYTQIEAEIRRPLHVAIYEAAEQTDTLILMLANPTAFPPGERRA